MINKKAIKLAWDTGRPLICALIYELINDLKNGREKGRKEEKKKRVIKHTLKYLYEAKMTAKKSTKTGKNFRGGGKNFSGWPEYIPLYEHDENKEKSMGGSFNYASGGKLLFRFF